MKRESGGMFPVSARRQGGFSLMELMIIIAILGTLSAIAIPNILSYRDNARLKGAAYNMLATLRKAQVTAVKRHYDTGLVFDTTAGTTTIFLDNGEGGAVANNGTQEPNEPTIDAFTVPVGCKILVNPIGWQTGFSQRGLPLNIGSVEIHSTSASAKVKYKASLSLAGHTKLEVSTDGGSSWQ